MKVFSQKEALLYIDQIMNVISTGGVIVCPSDTTYGMLVDSTNEVAARKLATLKERPIGKAISVFVSSLDMMNIYVDTSKLTSEVSSLVPGSYTLVLPAHHKTSKILEAEDGTLGVRYIKHNLVNALVSGYGKPLTATSANISGKGLCYTPQAFLNQLSDRKKELIDILIDAGELPHNPPSTIIYLAGHEPVILRANDHDFVKQRTYNTQNEVETGAVAQTIFEIIKLYLGRKPIVILLDGELGGGKTTWTKYFAALLGVKHIVSPTYTYECEYPIPPLQGVRETTAISKKNLSARKRASRFKHYDLYNVNNVEDITYLNIASNLTPTTIACIEWPGQLPEEEKSCIIQKAYVVKILFEYTNETERKLKIWWN